jgi:membrane associated rhomboid family serine protease
MFIPLYDHNPLEQIRWPYVNWLLIAANVLIFFFVQHAAGEDIFFARTVGYGLIPAYLLDGLPPPADLQLFTPEWGTLITHAFLHGDIWHLAGNMVFLWVFGDNIEDALGHVRYLLFFLLTAAAGGLAHALMLPDATGPLIGASGAVAGVIGAYLMLHPHTKLWVLVLARIPLKLSAIWPLIGWVLFQIVYAVIDKTSQVAWWAHIGGLVAGVLLVTVMRRPGVQLFDRGLAPPPAS